MKSMYYLHFASVMVQLLGLSTMVNPYQTCPRCMCLQVTDPQSWGRYGAGNSNWEDSNMGFESESEYQECSMPKSHEGQSLPLLETHMTQQGHGWYLLGHCVELVSSIPSRSMCLHVQKAVWFRKRLLFRESLSEKAVHQPPHELLYLLLLATHLSQALDVNEDRMVYNFMTVPFISTIFT